MRRAVAHNPFQSMLLDSGATPIFGEPASQQQAQQIAGEQSRVEALMADAGWHTVPELQKNLKQRYGQLYSETSISARLRAMRRRGFHVMHERTRMGSNLYQYRAFKLATHTLLSNGQVVAL